MAYSVVKFMVKVKLMEKSVKSHVGRVMVVNVMIQYSSPGMTWIMKSSTWPREPKEDNGTEVVPVRSLTMEEAASTAAVVEVVACWRDSVNELERAVVVTVIVVGQIDCCPCRTRGERAMIDRVCRSG